MSKKEQCKGYCLEFLTSRGLANYYTNSDFESVYRKHNGSKANPFFFALTAADIIILNAKPLTNVNK